MCYIWNENRMFCFSKTHTVIMKELDNAKETLKRECVDCAYVLTGPTPLYGNAGSSRKLKSYILESVKKNIGAENCVFWLDNLLIEHSVKDADRSVTINKVKAEYEILDGSIKNE